MEGVAGLDAVAGIKVVAGGVLRCRNTPPTLVTSVHRAIDAVVTIGGCAGETAALRVAELASVTGYAVVADAVVHRADAGAGGLVAMLARAVDPIVAVDGRSGDASDAGLAGLYAVAIDGVVAFERRI